MIEPANAFLAGTGRLGEVTCDGTREVDRLLALGATHLRDLSDGVELADPDGNEFGLRAG